MSFINFCTCPEYQRPDIIRSGSVTLVLSAAPYLFQLFGGMTSESCSTSSEVPTVTGCRDPRALSADANVLSRVQVNGSGLLKKTLFHAGLALKAATLPLGVSHLPVLDSVIFGPVRARLGGRVKVIVSGGAPLAHHVEHFLKATMGCPVTQVLHDRQVLCFCTHPDNEVQHISVCCICGTLAFPGPAA